MRLPSGPRRDNSRHRRFAPVAQDEEVAQQVESLQGANSNVPVSDAEVSQWLRNSRSSTGSSQGSPSSVSAKERFRSQVQQVLSQESQSRHENHRLISSARDSPAAGSEETLVACGGDYEKHHTQDYYGLDVADYLGYGGYYGPSGYLEPVLPKDDDNDRLPADDKKLPEVQAVQVKAVAFTIPEPGGGGGNYADAYSEVSTNYKGAEGRLEEQTPQDRPNYKPAVLRPWFALALVVAVLAVLGLTEYAARTLPDGAVISADAFFRPHDNLRASPNATEPAGIARSLGLRRAVYGRWMRDLEARAVEVGSGTSGASSTGSGTVLAPGASSPGNAGSGSAVASSTKGAETSSTASPDSSSSTPPAAGNGDGGAGPDTTTAVKPTTSPSPSPSPNSSSPSNVPPVISPPSISLPSISPPATSPPANTPPENNPPAISTPSISPPISPPVNNPPTNSPPGSGPPVNSPSTKTDVDELPTPPTQIPTRTATPAPTPTLTSTTSPTGPTEPPGGPSSPGQPPESSPALPPPVTESTKTSKPPVPPVQISTTQDTTTATTKLPDPTDIPPDPPGGGWTGWPPGGSPGGPPRPTSSSTTQTESPTKPIEFPTKPTDTQPTSTKGPGSPGDPEDPEGPSSPPGPINPWQPPTTDRPPPSATTTSTSRLPSPTEGPWNPVPPPPPVNDPTTQLPPAQPTTTSTGAVSSPIPPSPPVHNPTSLPPVHDPTSLPPRPTNGPPDPPHGPVTTSAWTPPPFANEPTTSSTMTSAKPTGDPPWSIPWPVPGPGGAETSTTKSGGGGPTTTSPPAQDPTGATSELPNNTIPLSSAPPPPDPTTGQPQVVPTSIQLTSQSSTTMSSPSARSSSSVVPSPVVSPPEQAIPVLTLTKTDRPHASPIAGSSPSDGTPTAVTSTRPIDMGGQFAAVTVISYTYTETNSLGIPTHTRPFQGVALPFTFISTDSNGVVTTITEDHIYAPVSSTLTDFQGRPTKTELIFVVPTVVTLTNAQGKPTGTSTSSITNTPVVTTLTGANGVPTLTRTYYEPVTVTSHTIITVPLNTGGPSLPQKGEVIETVIGADYVIGLVAPTMLAVLLSMAVRLFDHHVRLYFPFHSLTLYNGAPTMDSMCFPVTGPGGFLSGFGMVRRGQYLLAVTASMVIASAVLIVLSGGAVHIVRTGSSCSFASVDKCGTQIAVFPILARVLIALLAFLIVGTLVAGWTLGRWRTGVGQNPWNIHHMLGVSTNQDIRTSLQRLRETDGRITRSEATIALSSGPFVLNYWQENASLKYGILIGTTNPALQPLRKEGKTGGMIRRRYRLLPKGNTVPFSILALPGRFAFLLLLCVLLVGILSYNVVGGGELKAGTAGSQGQVYLAFLFVAAGVLISHCWSSTFHAVAFMSPYKVLGRKNNYADDILHMTPPTNIFSAVRSGLSRDSRDLFLVAVSLASLVSEFMPVLLLNIPFGMVKNNVTQLVCTWMTVCFLIGMIFVLASSLLMHWPHLPIDPSTIAGALYYASDPGVIALSPAAGLLLGQKSLNT